MPILSLLLVSIDDANRVASGAIIMGYLVGGLFFLRFWRRTHDRLFAIFALAFCVLAVNRLLGAAAGESGQARSLLYYTVRLIAFILILAAIVDKNRAMPKKSPPPWVG